MTFPAPTSYFPAPASYPEPKVAPWHGLTSVDQLLTAQTGVGAKVPTAPNNSGLAATSSSAVANLLSMPTGGAVSAANDPNTWTPESAAAQTDNAIARISAVNPALAEQLQQQRAGATEPVSGGGFLSDVKSALGFVTGLPVIHQALDLLSRTAHIVPEIAADEEGQSLWGNVAQALAGHSDKTFRDVLSQHHIFDDHPLVQAALGFAGDVAFDPMTYLTFGAGGVGRELLERGAARVGVEAAFVRAGDQGLSVLDKIGVESGIIDSIGAKVGSAEARAAVLDELTNSYLGKAVRVGKTGTEDAVTRLSNGLLSINPDAAGGTLADALRGSDAALNAQAIATANSAMEQAATGSLIGLGKKTPELAKALGLEEDTVRGILTNMRKAGNFGTKAEYESARAAAGLSGGIRFRVSIPGIRYSSPSLFPALVGDLPFQGLRRFMSGLSGVQRLKNMVETGTADVGDVRTFLTGAANAGSTLTRGGGIEELAKSSPAVASALMSGGWRSGFYSASEAMGRITAGFSRNAALYRGGGMGAWLSHAANQQGRQITESVGDAAWTGMLENPEVIKALESAGALPGRRVGSYTAKELQVGMHDVMAASRDTEAVRGLILFPTHDAQAAGADAWLAGETQKLAGQGLPPDELAAEQQSLQATYATMKDAEAKAAQNPAIKAAAMAYRELKGSVDKQSALNGVPSPDVAREFSGTEVINASQTKAATAGAHGVVKDAVLVPEGVSARGATSLEDGKTLASPELIDASGDYAGTHLVEVAAGETAHVSTDIENIKQSVRESVSGEAEFEVSKSEVEMQDALLSRLDPQLLAGDETNGYFKVVSGDHTYYLARRDGKLVGWRDVSQGNHVSAFGAPGYRGVQEGGATSIADDLLDAHWTDYGVKTVEDIRDVTGSLPGKVRFRTTAGAKLNERAIDRWATKVGAERRAVTTINRPLILVDDATLAANPGLLAGTEGTAAREEIEAQLQQLDEQFGQIADTAGQRAERVTSKMKPLKEGTRKFLLERGIDPDNQSVADILGIGSTMDDIERQARFRTLLAQAQGYDGIVRFRTAANGKDVVRDVTVFHPQDGKSLVPIKEVRDNAPVVTNSVGSYNRALSREFKDQLGKRTLSARQKRAIFGAETFDEAEAAAQRVAREHKIDLGSATGLEHDPFAAISQHVDQTAKSVQSAYLGRAKREMMRMGFGASPSLGPITGHQVYEAIVGPGTGAGATLAEKLERQDVTAGKNLRQVERLLGRGVIPDTQRAAERISQELDAARNDIGARVAAGETPIFRGVRSQTGKGQGLWGSLTHGTTRVEDIDGVVETMFLKKDAKVLSQGSEEYQALVHRGVEEGPSGGLSAIAATAKQRGYDAIAMDDGSMAVLNNAAITRKAQGAAKAAEADVRSEAKVSVKYAPAQDALNAYNKTVAAMRTAQADVKPAIIDSAEAANMAGMVPIQVEGLQHLSMPAFMAEEFHNAARGYKSLYQFQTSWRKFNSVWKDWATWKFPGFHVRNFMGAWFNNWLGGVDVMDYVHWTRAQKALHDANSDWATRKLGEKFVRDHGLWRYGVGKDMTYADLGALASDLGLTQSHGRAFAEARIGAETAARKTVGEKIPVLNKGVRGYNRLMRGAGTTTENLFRGAGFLKGLRDTHGDMFGARAFVMMRQGDYQDLTDTEYGWIRDVIPFYKWTRTNTPLQIHQLFENPGKLLGVLKAKDAAWAAQGLDHRDYQHKMPEWMDEGFAIPLPGSHADAMHLLMLDLPMNDLYKGATDYVSMLAPLARPILESYVFHESIFSGKPITGDAVPVSQGLGYLGKVLAPLGVGAYNAQGQYTIDERLQNSLSVLPMLSRFRDWTYADPDRTGLRAASVISAGAGLGIRPFGEEQFTQQELSFYYTQVEPQLTYLKSLGYEPPTTDDLKAGFQQLAGAAETNTSGVQSLLGGTAA